MAFCTVFTLLPSDVTFTVTIGTSMARVLLVRFRSCRKRIRTVSLQQGVSCLDHANQSMTVQQLLKRCSVNPNAHTTYKILQRLFPTISYSLSVQMPYLIYNHRAVHLPKQIPWYAATSSHLPRSRSQVQAPAPTGKMHMLFLLPSILLC